MKQKEKSSEKLEKDAAKGNPNSKSILARRGRRSKFNTRGGGKLEASRDRVLNGFSGVIILFNAVEEVVVLLAVALYDLFVMAGVGPHSGKGEVLAL